MLRTKKADRIAAFFTAVMLIASVCLWGAVEPVQGDGSHVIGYEELLFDQSRVHTIDITMSDWDDLIANAAAEEYHECEITIDGEKQGKVGIRAKGNTSLSSVASLGSSRYSFKIEFDHYTKGKSYHGLDKLSLNNLIQDATMMKDYLSYTLMNRMGVPSPLCSYAQISVNGESWGLYLAAEAVEDAFLERNGMTKGELYKPDSMSFGGGRGNGRDFDMDRFREQDDGGETAQDGESGASGEPGEAGEGSGQSAAPDAGDFASSFGGSAGGTTGGETGEAQNGQNFAGSAGGQAGSEAGSEGDDFAPSSGTPGNMPQELPEGISDEMKEKIAEVAEGGFGGFNFGMGNDDVKLIYTDDDPDSYSNIFNNAKTTIKTKDKTRLIESLRKLNAREDIDSVVNREEVITYLAVHNFLCNDDSYTGMMVHNYYLYEEKGKLTIIPWDYNLGFGGFSASENATSTVNSPIDNPVSGGTNDSRPLVSWIFSDEEAQASYHEIYSRFIAECVESGWLGEEIARVREMITPFVQEDPTAFYTMDEFEKAADTLQVFCRKRGESIRGQLDGTIPSTTDGQRSSSALIDASDISIQDMGSMNNGRDGGMGGPGEMPTGMPEGFAPGQMPGNTATGEASEDALSGTEARTVPETGGTEDAGSFGGSAGSSGESAQNTAAAPSGMPEASLPPETPGTERPAGTEQQAGAAAEEPGQQETPEPGTGKSPRSESLPEDMFRPGDNSGRGYSSEIWIWTGICAAVLIAAVLIIRRAGSHNNG